MKKLGFGIIGLGMISEFHMEAIRGVEDAEIKAVSSRNEERAKEVGEKENCFWTSDYKALLASEEVDVVCVTTSSGSHAEIGLEVLRSGKHLVIEKPLAMTSEQAQILVNEAKERGLLISVISQRRFESQHQAIRSVLDEGKLGKLLLVEVTCPYYRTQAYYDSADWRGTIAEDGGALMNQAIHSIDLLLWFADAPVQSVYGKIATQTHVMEAEDLGMAILTFRGGHFGKIMASTSIQPGFAPKLAIFGERGSIIVEGKDVVHWSVPDVAAPEKLISGTGGGHSDPRAIPTEYHRLQMQDVVHAIHKGSSPSITGEDGVRTVRLIESIVRSSAEGREIVMDEERGSE